VYPFPLIEDGDFDIPSVYMKDVDGEKLAGYAGQRVALDIRATRKPAKGCNVIARKGTDNRRVVIFAHIDAKSSTCWVEITISLLSVSRFSPKTV